MIVFVSTCFFLHSSSFMTSSSNCCTFRSKVRLAVQPLLEQAKYSHGDLLVRTLSDCVSCPNGCLLSGRFSTVLCRRLPLSRFTSPFSPPPCWRCMFPSLFACQNMPKSDPRSGDVKTHVKKLLASHTHTHLSGKASRELQVPGLQK